MGQMGYSEGEGRMAARFRLGRLAGEGGNFPRWGSVRENYVLGAIKQQEPHLRHSESELLTERPREDSQRVRPG